MASNTTNTTDTVSQANDKKTQAQAPEGLTWFEIRICSSHADAEKGISKKLNNSQLLEWFSHKHRFQSENEEWCPGRVFIDADNILNRVEKDDVVAVYMCASGNLENNATEGYLSFDYGGYGGSGIPLTLPKPRNPPRVLVYGEKRRECLMTQIPGSSAKKTVFVDGGVDLMYRLLQSEGNNWTVTPHELRSKEPMADPHTLFELENVKPANGVPFTIGQYETVRQYTLRGSKGKSEDYHQGESKVDFEPDPKIIIWNDFGVTRSDSASAKSDASLLIYRMRAAVFQEGGFWDKAREATQHKVRIKVRTKLGEKIISGPRTQQVLVVVDADDVRAHSFHISRRVSWEKTIEDFQAHFKEFIEDVHEKVHVIVRLGYEGAIYVPPTSKDDRKKPDDPQFHCYLVPDKTEGDLLRAHKGNIPGIDMAFVAGLTASLVRESLDSLANLSKTQVGAAIELALTWSHRFARVRFCKDRGGSLNYPCPQHFDLEEFPKPKLISFAAKGTIKEDGKWSLFNLLSRVKEDVSRDIVIKGLTDWLEGSVPTARFGNLLTADRKEIECYRSIAVVIDEYLALQPGKPLSIAVFGSPGSGKSFGVKEVVKTMIPSFKDAIEVNLSQFMSHSELLATFHNIRDQALSGPTPVVMFDEFDSVFERQELGWLKYFLAPMQDGYFLEDGKQHSLKNAIFIFIGGTSENWAQFTKHMDPDEDDSTNQPASKGTVTIRTDSAIINTDTSAINKDASMFKTNTATIKTDTLTIDTATITNDREKIERLREEHKRAKKPDFVSRLSAYVDIRGLNKIDDEDEMYMIRRAMILRSILLQRLQVSGGKDIPVDDRVLNALLRQEKYRHGARSVTLILQMSALSGKDRFEASALPPVEQLRMHIKVDEFKARIRENYHNESTHNGKKNDKKRLEQIDVELRKVLMNNLCLDARMMEE
ncbi:pathway-specific regulatory nit-4 [Fusarium longipes]|uniref:Pathway-specific regulatory nit-4 n=1 Tax=Fusarium longipes TaxID=694270 RepID=A0A395SA84_9HYPO|nr:pathway-specific regulatory nit-4 [Fusarium longipes]